MIITIAFIVSNSEVSASRINLAYLPSPPTNLITALPLLFVFMNISLAAFGGIFKYLQVDFLAELGRLLRLKKEIE